MDSNFYDSQIEIMQQSRDQVKRELDYQKQLNQDLKSELDSLKQEMREYQQSQINENGNGEQLRSEINLLKRQLTSLRQENADLNEEIQDKNKDLLKMGQDLSTALEEKQQIQEQKNSISEQLNTQEVEIQRLLKQKESLNNEILEYQSKFSQYKEEIVKLDKENVNLDDKLIEKERELERLRGELSVMERMFGNIANRTSATMANQIMLDPAPQDINQNSYNIQQQQQEMNSPSTTRDQFRAIRDPFLEGERPSRNYRSARGRNMSFHSPAKSPTRVMNHQFDDKIVAQGRQRSSTTKVNFSSFQENSLNPHQNNNLQTQSKRANHLNRQSLIDGSTSYNNFIPQQNQIEETHQKAKKIAEVSKTGSKNLLAWGDTGGKYPNCNFVEDHLSKKELRRRRLNQIQQSNGFQGNTAEMMRQAMDEEQGNRFTPQKPNRNLNASQNNQQDQFNKRMNKTAPHGGFYSPHNFEIGQGEEQNSHMKGFRNRNKSNVRKAPKLSRRDVPRQLVEPVDQGGYPQDIHHSQFNQVDSIPGPQGNNFSAHNPHSTSTRARFGARKDSGPDNVNNLGRNLSPRFDINRLNSKQGLNDDQRKAGNYIPRKGQLKEPSMLKNMDEMTDLERETHRLETHLMKTQMERDELKSQLDKLERNGRRTGKLIRERRDLEAEYKEKEKYVGIIKKNLRDLKK